ncbi:hypothetical protein INH39_10370 [Massilia violaceinigra]|uniref:Uncharacterized protein n=1 Tax=Massilia violaceinigra TaxID=2045208 RepID=A0ABY4ACB6_9BURK|nr:hypothetical protein [Massilia violaceinigra]UOD32032.1 hypothetical protein INH39_10370 [Massilia violaceinigra]
MENFLIKRKVFGSISELSIDHEQYKTILNAINIEKEAFFLEQKYDFIVENYAEFEDELLKVGVRDLIFSSQNRTWYNINRALFDRRIMNLLTTFKTYEDTYPQHLNRIFGKDLIQLNSAKAKFSSEYDSRLGYKTMCKLRNYIQHEGLPVHGSYYHSQWLAAGEERKGINRNTVDPFLRPEELRSGGFNRTVLQELEKAGEKIDLKMLVRDFMEGLSIGHVFLRSLLTQNLIDANKILKDVLSLYGNNFPEEKSLIGLAIIHATSDGDVKETFFNTSSENHRVYLENKNRELVNLSKQYVSSEVVNN